MPDSTSFPMSSSQTSYHSSGMSDSDNSRLCKMMQAVKIYTTFFTSHDFLILTFKPCRHGNRLWNKPMECSDLNRALDIFVLQKIAFDLKAGFTCIPLISRNHSFKRIECRVSNNELSTPKVIILIQIQVTISPRTIVMCWTWPSNVGIQNTTMIITNNQGVDSISTFPSIEVFSRPLRRFCEENWCTVNNSNLAAHKWCKTCERCYVSPLQTANKLLDRKVIK